MAIKVCGDLELQQLSVKAAYKFLLHRAVEKELAASPFLSLRFTLTAFGRDVGNGWLPPAFRCMCDRWYGADGMGSSTLVKPLKIPSPRVRSATSPPLPSI